MNDLKPRVVYAYTPWWLSLKWSVDRLVRWEGLRRIGRLRALRSSYFFFVFVPIAAKVVHSSRLDQGIAIPGLSHPLVVTLPFSWFVFYFASTAFVVATTVYLFFCPAIIRNFSSFSQFRRQGHGQQPIKDAVLAPILKGTPGAQLQSYEHFLGLYVQHKNVSAVIESFKGLSPEGLGIHISADLYLERIPDPQLADAFAYARHVNDSSKPVARWTAAFFYAAGFALLGVLAIQNFRSVLGLWFR